MIKVHDSFRDLPEDPAGRFLANRWAFFREFFLEPTGGLLEEYWRASGITGELRAAIEGERGFSVVWAMDRYRSLPKGALEHAVRASAGVLGDLDASVYLVPGLFAANAMTVFLGGTAVAVICLEQNGGAEDLCACMAHELSHVALSRSYTGPVTVGLALFSEGLATAAALKALEGYRAGPVADPDLAAVLWYPPEVLEWCREHEARLWRTARPVLDSENRNHHHDLLAKFSGDFWKDDGTPYRAGYYLGYVAVADLLESGVTLSQAHRMPGPAMTTALVRRAQKATGPGTT
ncbi:MAG: hypothetical protein AB1445_15610 [Bacillota bacterium]